MLNLFIQLSARRDARIFGGMHSMVLRLVTWKQKFTHDDRCITGLERK
jgi:hypothetical protein